MSRFPEALAILILAATPALAGPYGLGRPALPEEIAAWDRDIHPDGTGLPVGSGSVEDGEAIFAEKCAACHGDFAEGIDNWPKLAGGMDTLADKDPTKTVGSYWPHLSTAIDYINRSMPFGDAQSLTADEVYAVTAYILYSNYLVEDDFTLSNETFAEVTLPNAEGFIIDDRAETEYAHWSGEPCMENCKESVEITMRAMVLDVTPDQDGGIEEETEIGTAEEADAVDPELIAAGEKVFKKCKACHQVGDGAKNRSGPVLNGIVGRAAAGVEGFRYSNALKAKGEEGLVWDEASLAAFLADPKGYIKGTKMSFRGLKRRRTSLPSLPISRVSLRTRKAPPDYRRGRDSARPRWATSQGLYPSVPLHPGNLRLSAPNYAASSCPRRSSQAHVRR